MIYSTFATIIAITLSAMAAFVLSRNRTRANRYIYYLIVMGIALPMNFVTLTKVMQLTHLINTQIGIIILYAATQIPLSVFIIYAFVETIPRELDEAAIIDGCGPFRLFFHYTSFVEAGSGYYRYSKFSVDLERVPTAPVLFEQKHLLAHDPGNLQFFWTIRV